MGDLLFTIAMFFLVTYTGFYGWNNILTHLFALPMLTYWQAIACSFALTGIRGIGPNDWIKREYAYNDGRPMSKFELNISVLIGNLIILLLCWIGTKII